MLRADAAQVAAALATLNALPLVRGLQTGEEAAAQAAAAVAGWTAAAVLDSIVVQLRAEWRKAAEACTLIDDEVHLASFCLACGPLKRQACIYIAQESGAPRQVHLSAKAS